MLMFSSVFTYHEYNKNDEGEWLFHETGKGCITIWLTIITIVWFSYDSFCLYTIFKMRWYNCLHIICKCFSNTFSQPAHNVKTTLYGRLLNVLTPIQRPYNVVCQLGWVCLIFFFSCCNPLLKVTVEKYK